MAARHPTLAPTATLPFLFSFTEAEEGFALFLTHRGWRRLCILEGQVVEADLGPRAFHYEQVGRAPAIKSIKGLIAGGASQCHAGADCDGTGASQDSLYLNRSTLSTGNGSRQIVTVSHRRGPLDNTCTMGPFSQSSQKPLSSVVQKHAEQGGN